MNRRTGPALALLVLCLSTANSFASQCDGAGVSATQAAVQAQCCPARRHGAYVSCAAHIARTAIRAHVLSPACKHRILRAQCAVPTTTTAASTTTTSSPVTTTSTVVATTTTFTATTSTTTTTDDGPHKGTTSTTTLPPPSTTSTSSTTSTLPQASTTTAPPTTTTLPPPLFTGTTTTLPVTQEICGNCIDDDGDGVTDFEDPACCAQTLPLAVQRMVLKPLGLHVHGHRLKMKARYAVPAPALFDPAAQDTTLQIADAQGELFCQTITANHWMHPRRPLYRFKDKQGRFAGGLKKGRFKVKRNGMVLFRTRGKQVALRPTDGDTIVVTVRVGTQCARETMSLRTAKTALVFP
jgi:hypothetical protein